MRKSIFLIFVFVKPHHTGYINALHLVYCLRTNPQILNIAYSSIQKKIRTDYVGSPPPFFFSSICDFSFLSREKLFVIFP